MTRLQGVPRGAAPCRAPVPHRIPAPDGPQGLRELRREHRPDVFGVLPRRAEDSPAPALLGQLRVQQTGRRLAM